MRPFFTKEEKTILCLLNLYRTAPPLLLPLNRVGHSSVKFGKSGEVLRPRLMRTNSTKLISLCDARFGATLDLTSIYLEIAFLNLVHLLPEVELA